MVEPLHIMATLNWGEKKVAMMIDDWIFYQILSTNSFKKMYGDQPEEFYVDIGVER